MRQQPAWTGNVPDWMKFVVPFWIAFLVAVMLASFGFVCSLMCDSRFVDFTAPQSGAVGDGGGAVDEGDHGCVCVR